MSGIDATPEVLDSLRTRLLVRPGLADVAVFTGPAGDEGTNRMIVFFGADGTDDDTQSFDSDVEFGSYVIYGSVFSQKPGAGEDTIKAARDDAKMILDELRNELVDDPTLDDLVMGSSVHSSQLHQGIEPNARWCEIRFRIDAGTAT